MRPLPTYPDMAKALDILRCRGITSSGHYCMGFDHSTGEAERGRIHWADRRSSWPGVVRFLKLAAVARDPSLNEDQPWRRVYRIDMALVDMSKEVHVRVPARYLVMDRAFVRASVATIPNSEPLRRRAFHWSRRTGGKTT